MTPESSGSVDGGAHTDPNVDAAQSHLVLVVDDSEFVRTALTGALESREFTVIGAKNGKEALEILARETAIEAMVLDLKMPILDGKMVLLTLDKATGQSPFVIAVADPDERASLDECRGLGADEILTKPLDVEAVCRLLRKALTTG